MTLQEALFLSSQHKAYYEYGLPPSNTSHKFRCYRVEITFREEVWTPVLSEKTRNRDVYEITVCRKEGETVYPPHLKEKTYSLDDCIIYLHAWMVGEEFEHPWHPVEVWDTDAKEERLDNAE